MSATYSIDATYKTEKERYIGIFREDEHSREEYVFMPNRMNYFFAVDTDYTPNAEEMPNSRGWIIEMTKDHVSVIENGEDYTPEVQSDNSNWKQIYKSYTWQLNDQGEAIAFKRTKNKKEEIIDDKVKAQESFDSFKLGNVPHLKKEFEPEQFDKTEFSKLKSIDFSNSRSEQRRQVVLKNQEKFIHFMHGQENLTIAQMHKQFVDLKVGQLTKKLGQ